MRLVIQRVSQASVTVDGQVVGQCGRGFCILAGVRVGDTQAEARWLANKVANLRIFEDDAGKMNRSIAEAGGQILVVSQFTLLGDCRKGRRPSFDPAAPPEQAKTLYERFVNEIDGLGIPAATGVFQATMDVELANQGPVTFILDSRKRF